MGSARALACGTRRLAAFNERAKTTATTVIPILQQNAAQGGMSH
jgi:hypothetical protein